MTGGTIVIVGGGWEAWLAAAMLAGLLRGSHAITVVGREAAPIMPVVPTTAEAQGTHRLLRLDPAALDRVAVPRWGAWVEADTRFFVPGLPFAGAEPPFDFAQQWIRLRARGRAEPLAAYSPAEKLATAPGRAADKRVASGAGLFLEPVGYAALLRAVAENRGVRRIGAAPVAVARDGEHRVAALVLEDGTQVEADWFLDGSAHRRTLVEGLLGAMWRGDEGGAFAVETDGVSAASARGATFVRDGAGWRWAMPLPAGSVSGRLSRGGDPGAAWRPGALDQAWWGNVLAIGSAQRLLHPLEPLAVERVQRAVARLFTLFPRRETLPAVAREYQRQLDADDRGCARAAWAVEALTGGPDPMDLARAKLLFRQTGRLPDEEGDPFTPDQWLALFVGAGAVPQRHDPNADRLGLDAAAERLRRGAAAVRAFLPAG